MSDNFTGLSILIPIYNCDIRKFIQEIAFQASSLKIPFEILAFDDDSNSVFKELNKEVGKIENVEYKELPRNYGRSAIRNLLADNSRYSHLLFLDCDGKVVKEDYLKKYLNHLDFDTIVGGRVYSQNPPANSQYLLHWKTGKQKEEIGANLRNRNPYESLMFNNILIRRSIYSKIRLDENIIGYGHEDTLFGHHLKQLKCSILHIDNPIEHWHLDSNEDFLKKAETAISNFNLILREKEAGKETKLYKYYMILNKYKISGLFHFLTALLLPLIKKNLQSNSPFIPFLDIIKLYWLRKQIKQSSKGTIL